jgi:tRNA(Ile2) C34 agmatinyltransferase TiaS
MSNLTHTTCGGVMKNHKNGLICTKCGYKLKDKEINPAFMAGKLEVPIPKGECKEMKA